MKTGYDQHNTLESLRKELENWSTKRINGRLVIYLSYIRFDFRRCNRREKNRIEKSWNVISFDIGYVKY